MPEESRRERRRIVRKDKEQTEKQWNSPTKDRGNINYPIAL